MLDLTAEQKRRRWLSLGIVALAYVLSFFQRFAPAGIAQVLAASFSTSAASLGALAATYFYVYTLMQIPTGILADTLGPRRILALGGVIGGLGSFMFGFAPSLDWALGGRTLIGLGVSVTFIAMLKLIAVWFEESRFATMVGICMLVGNMGSVLAGAPLCIKNYNITELVEFYGYVNHQKAIEFQNTARVLLLIINNTTNNWSILTGKIFEYMATGHPIMCIGPLDGDAAYILKQIDNAKVLNYNDIEGTKQFLVDQFKNFISGKEVQSSNNENIDQYTRNNLTKKLVSILDIISSKSHSK